MSQAMAMGAAAAVLLPFFVYFNIRGNMPGMLATKPLLSFLFVLTAWQQPTDLPFYARLLIGALSLCWIGDVCLIFPAAGLFLTGLVFFLAAHLLYALAYLYLADVNVWSAVGAMAAIPIALRVYAWLRPHLGKMKSPVGIYMAVISAMIIAAMTLGGDPGYAFKGRALVVAGALGFYLSDIFVARQQFVASGISNRLIGPPLYFISQFMLAFSISGLTN